jgi:hypothetical protein
MISKVNETDEKGSIHAMIDSSIPAFSWRE